MKSLIRLLAIASLQFALTQLVSVMMRAAAATAAFKETAPLHLKALTLLATALHFPVITLALYPRHLFPGNLILIPIAVNSLLWALSGLGVWHLYRNRSHEK